MTGWVLVGALVASFFIGVFCGVCILALMMANGKDDR